MLQKKSITFYNGNKPETSRKWKFLKEVIIKLIKRYVLTDNDLFQCGQECEAIPNQ